MNPSIDLDAAKAAFFASGGGILVVEGFQYQPHRPHRDEEIVRASPEKKEDPRLVRKRSQISEIRKLAKTMTAEQVHQATGYPRQTLFRLAREGNFVFRRPEPRLRKECKREIQREAAREQKEAERAKMLERICEMRDVGLNRAQVARQLGINYGTLVKLIARSGVTFPKARTRA